MFKWVAGILTVGGATALAGTWFGAFIVVIVVSMAFGEFAAQHTWLYWGYIWLTFLAAYGGIIVAAGSAWQSQRSRQNARSGARRVGESWDAAYAVGYTIFTAVLWVILASAVLAIPSSFVANAACDHNFSRPTLVMDGIPALGIVRQVGGYQPMTCENLDH